MCAKLVLLVCLITCYQGSNAASVSFITKCKIDDYKCQKESAQIAIKSFAAGISEFGVEPLEPLKYASLDASSKELKLLLSDVVLSGAKDCIIKKLQVKDSQLSVMASCDIEVNGQYELGGQLLFLPIEGKGKAYASLKNVVVQVDADLKEKTGKDGKVHWDITTWKHSYELKDKAVIDLEDLFPNNELLGRAARDLLKTSPNAVIGEVGPPIIKALLTKVVKNVDKFFKAVPLEELVEK